MYYAVLAGGVNTKRLLAEQEMKAVPLIHTS